MTRVSRGANGGQGSVGGQRVSTESTAPVVFHNSILRNRLSPVTGRRHPRGPSPRHPSDRPCPRRRTGLQRRSNRESTIRSSHRSRRFRTGVRSTGVCSTCHTRRSAATSTRRTSLRNRRCHIPCPSSPGRNWGRTCRSNRSRRLRTGTQSRCTFHRSHLECRRPGALPRSPHRVWAHPRLATS
jgi:hypothetical protein